MAAVVIAGADVEHGWVERWRADMRALLERLLRDFETRHGYPPGEHDVSGPSTGVELAGLAALHGPALPADLRVFHEVVAEVRLPDVHHGYWIHRPSPPGAAVGHPHLLTDGRPIVVFGSDGGGVLFALAAPTGAPVLGLAAGADIDGAYDAANARVVADDLRHFLTLMRARTAETVAGQGPSAGAGRA